ncbi:hypothetical protein FB567DRAFT_196705 [Paraphoma chrysanthemicola]|uniref:AB hydrolase-1 domain-containing protein n=1 Tax=Paraphoma chrysanthemicola TaxID=798071 RepID=A0A8K0QUM0_9PLEO|nr:hypothetical protein FB567DRAFT_196705 [Paraphoma chrysanthemicola]
MRLPEPEYSFTIPSIHDDTTLNCRVYHPEGLDERRPSTPDATTQWRTRGIIMAHPYAPMGGSYDDRVVGMIVDEFLQAGYIVGTFNFRYDPRRAEDDALGLTYSRGAHGSKGRTSWSGKPELDDYTSFAAFFVHYVTYLRPHPTPDVSFSPDQSPVKPRASQIEPSASGKARETPLVILGGYSYGSLILKHLPPVPTLLQPFSSPVTGSASDEIIMRAHKLADQSNLAWINTARSREREQKARTKHHEQKPSLTMGGEETSPDKRRSSRDVRRSVEGGLSVEIGSRLRSLSHRRRKDSSPAVSLEKKATTLSTLPEVRYLLISPLSPPISTLAAPALGHKIWNRGTEAFHDVIGKHATFAIYGGQDIFTSAKRTRAWSEQLRAAPGSRFTSLEVAEAGHFWVEKGVEQKLRVALRDWQNHI